MKTTLITLKDTVVGDNFPVLTNHGIIDNTYIGTFIYNVEKAGYILTNGQIEALNAFWEAGEQGGWINSLMYMLPFIGSREYPKAAAVPLIDKFGGGDYLKIVKPSIGIDSEDDNYSDFFAYDSSGNVLGAIPTGATKLLICNISPADLFYKASDSKYKNSCKYGWTWYGKLKASSEYSGIIRFGGASDMEIGNYYGISTGKLYFEEFGVSQNWGMNDYFKNGTGAFLNLSIKASGNNIAQGTARLSDFTGVITAESAERSQPLSINDELLKQGRFGLCGQYGAINKTITNSLTTTGLEMRYWAFHDGGIPSDSDSYANAIKALMTAFNKI